MRAALWLLALFGIAAALALFAGNNQSTVTLFWPPWRVDLSLNLVLILLLAAFVLLHTALRALAALFDLPKQAQRWRTQQKERAMYGALMDALSHLLAGRFIRARKLADGTLSQAKALADSGHSRVNTHRLQSLAHLVAAESAQSLQDPASRDSHLEQALGFAAGREEQETREAAILSAARWALVNRDAEAALDWLDKLPQGASRRTLALRIKLKAARLARRTPQALDTARLLAKHGAFSASAAQSIVRGLTLDLLSAAYDPNQLHSAWSQLDSAERQMPDVAVHAAQRLLALQGDALQAQQWLLPVWERMLAQPDALTEAQQLKLVRVLEAAFGAASTPLDGLWLARIETALQNNPRDAKLQYLAGFACLQQQLWGKAQQLLTQAASNLQDTGFQRSAWQALARLAEQRDDAEAVQQAWRRAGSV